MAISCLGQINNPKELLFLSKERFNVLRFVDDLAGALYDIFKFMIRSISYLLSGMLMVAVPIYLIVWVIGIFQ